MVFFDVKKLKGLNNFDKKTNTMQSAPKEKNAESECSV
jgi:hypothetical protein